SSRRRHTRSDRDWSSDVCSSDLARGLWSILGPEARDTLDNAPPAGEHAHSEGSLGLYVATDGGVDVIGERPELPEASEQTAEIRSEERRVGKEGRARWWRYQFRK